MKPPTGSLPPGTVLVELHAVWSRRDVLLAGLREEERAIFDAFQVEKRASDWLGGRIAAKRAVQRELGLAFSQLAVLPSERDSDRGLPLVFVGGARLETLHVTISHAGGLAAAWAGGARAGLDLERVERRAPSFEALFLDEDARAELEHLTPDERARAVTRRWCVTEAIGKARGVGLARPFSELVAEPRDQASAPGPEGRTLPLATPSLVVDAGFLTHAGQVLAWAFAR